MLRSISAPLVVAWLWFCPSGAWAQEWGPPPPNVPRASENSGDAEPERPPEPAPPPETEPRVEEPEAPNQPAEPAEAPSNTPEEEEQAEEHEGEAPAEGTAEHQNWLRRMLKRIEFHGYSRMPLNFMFQPNHQADTTGDSTGGDGDTGARTKVRLPYLMNNDYYNSGFAYLRHQETDWSELYLTANVHDDVSITAGLFASLYSDYANVSTASQFGLAQAFLTWRNIGGVEPLSLRVGVFWDKLGYLQPYDTYVFGRTHHWGLQLGWDFPNGARIRIGGGAHLDVTDNNEGYTPLVYAFGGTPIGPVTLNAYVIGLWMNDIPPMRQWEEGSLVVAGLDARIDFPWFDGPLYIALAGYFADHPRYLANAFELLHSRGGRGLTENFLALGTDNPSARLIVGGLDWPVTIWRGLYARLYGMLTHVWIVDDTQDPEAEPSEFDDRTYLKWGFEGGYRFLDWLAIGLVYDRVILDMHHPGRAYRAVTPRIVFTPYRDIEIELTYTHYFYGDDINLDRVEHPPGVSHADEDVFHIMAEATW